MRKFGIIALGLLSLAWGMAAWGMAAQADDVERIERGPLIIEGVPEIPSEISERLRQYNNTRSAGFIGWEPNGKGIMISTRFGEVSQLHHVAAPGARRAQITFYDEPVVAASYPHTEGVDGFVFQRDVGGAEDHQLFFSDASTGAVRLLTDGTSRNGGATWSNKGDLIAFQSNRRDGKSWDIYTVTPDGPETTRMVFQSDGMGYWGPGAFSRDDRYLAVLNYRSTTDSNLYIVNLADGTKRLVGPKGVTAFYGGALFSADGSGLYFVSNLNAEFKTLRYIDLASGEISDVSGLPWDVSSFDLSPDGRTLAFVVNEGGLSSLYTVDIGSGERTKVKMPVGVIGGVAFSPDGASIGMTLNSATSPADVYAYDMESVKLVRWTTSEVGGLDPANFASVNFFAYPTFDKTDDAPRQIPAFIYRPAGDGPHPVLINIHGGPEGQARPTFSAGLQFIASELGMAVIRPNVRGSAGFGKEYLGLDNGYKREDSVKDIGALLDWIAIQPDLDETRVIVYGGSYGGYMVLASMVHYNDRLLGAIDVVGISNFVTFLENTRAYRRDLRRVEYGDERDPDMRAFLERISPDNNAAKITRPMLIIQGVNDPRVPVTESEQMVATLRAQGNEVWYVAAKNEGHGFRKKSNRDYQSAAVALFIGKLLAEE